MPFAFAAILIRHVSFRKQHQGFGVEVHLFPFYCLVSDIFILLLKRCGRVPLESCSFFLPLSLTLTVENERGRESPSLF